jgi:hypothetical protein
MLKAKDVILKDNKLYIDADAIIKSIKEHTAVAGFLVYEIQDLKYQLKLTAEKPEEKEDAFTGEEI